MILVDKREHKEIWSVKTALLKWRLIICSYKKVTAAVASNQQRNKFIQFLLSEQLDFFSCYLLGIFVNAKLFLVFITSLRTF